MTFRGGGGGVWIFSGTTHCRWQGFKEATSRLHKFFSSTEFSQYVCIVYGVNEMTTPQLSVAIELAKFIFWEFLEALAAIIRKDKMEGAILMSERWMWWGDGCGGEIEGSIRSWLGSKESPSSGWKLHTKKCVHQFKFYPVHSGNKQRVCKLLEENIVQSFDYLQEKSNFQETLQVTEGRQCRQRGLLHI